jgi:hypothetical protein
MTTDEERINEMVFEATAALVKDFCATRIGEGATREQVNAELKDSIPQINAWAARQRRLAKLMVLDQPSSELQ